MKFKTKIVPEDGGYIGLVLLGEDIVHFTNNHNDPNLVAHELSAYISSAAQQPVINTPTKSIKTFVQSPVSDNSMPTKPTNSATPPPQPPPIIIPKSQIVNQPTPRKCCGRR